MASTEQQFAEAVDQLQARTGWEMLTAYERTKALLEILANRGLEAPNWTVIRGLIGKGSSTDINRAKRDFRKELGVQLSRMRGAKGMPEEVSDACSKLWLLAVEQAGKTFDDQVNAFNAELERAEAAQADAEAACEEALTRVQALQGEKAGLQAAVGSLQSLADTERAAKEQAQQMFEAARLELAGQLEQTKAALVNAQAETAKSIEQFKGMENRFQQEIDRTRRELAAERDRMHAEHVKEQTTLTTAKDRARIQMGVEQSKRQDVERRLAASKAEAVELRRQLTAAQETIRKALQSRKAEVTQNSKAPRKSAQKR